MKMKEKKPTLKEKFSAYRREAMDFIRLVKNPVIRPALTVNSYDTVAGQKKMNVIPVPEIAAIVGTAAKLDNEIRLRSYDNVLIFEFVSKAPSTPLSLSY